MEPVNDTAPTPADVRKALDESIATSRVRLTGDAGAFFGAMAKAQAEFEPVKKDAKADLGQYGYAYAPLENLLAATVPALNKHGLCLMQPLASKAGGGHLLRTWIGHSSGALLEMETDIPRADKIQALGSSITYLRRYTVQSLLGVNGEDDDDGNAADGNAPRIERRPARQQPSAAPQARRPGPPPATNGAPAARASDTAAPSPPPDNAPAQAAPAAEAPAEVQRDPEPITEEQDLEIGALFKRLKFSRPAATELVMNLVGKGPARLSRQDGDVVLAELRAKVAGGAKAS